MPHVSYRPLERYRWRWPVDDVTICSEIEYMNCDNADFHMWFPLDQYERNFYTYDLSEHGLGSFELAGLFFYFPCCLVRGRDMVMGG